MGDTNEDLFTWNVKFLAKLEEILLSDDCYTGFAIIVRKTEEGLKLEYIYNDPLQIVQLLDFAYQDLTTEKYYDITGNRKTGEDSD